MTDPFSTSAGLVDGLSSQMNRLEEVTGRFGRTLSRSLVQGIAHGKSLEEVFKGLGEKLVSLSLNAALQPMENAISGLFGSLSGSARNLLTSTLTGSSGPSLFSSFGGGGGAMFAAPAAGSAPLNITMNVSTPDATSFRAAEAQVSATLARAVARGQRSL